MNYATPDPQVLGYLGRALSLEMSSMQQYMSVAQLLKLRGFDDMSDRFMHEAEEEMAHAGRIVGRMHVLGAAPGATQLRPAKVGDSLPAVINTVRAIETEIVAFYQEAVQYCSGIGDVDSQFFFEKLLQEEKQHSAFLDDWQSSFLAPKGG